MTDSVPQHNGLWQEALTRLRPQMTKSAFDSIFIGSEGRLTGEGEFTVYASSEMSRGWMKNRWAGHVVRALKAELDYAPTVEFKDKSLEVMGLIEDPEQVPIEGNFPGFEEPKQNWFKYPVVLINFMDQIETLAEKKVIDYIVRHTWGFHQDQKLITLNEFVNGRKCRAKSACKCAECKARGINNRMDHGTGMTKKSVIDGLKRAVKHGFVKVYVDTKDKARTKKYYSLRGV